MIGARKVIVENITCIQNILVTQAGRAMASLDTSPSPTEHLFLKVLWAPFLMKLSKT